MSTSTASGNFHPEDTKKGESWDTWIFTGSSSHFGMPLGAGGARAPPEYGNKSATETAFFAVIDC
jgi:hypothetical protein